MSAKKSRKSPLGKAKNPVVLLMEDNDATLAEFQRQLEFSRLESHEARRLLEELGKTAHELSRLSDSALENLDALKLGLVISACFAVLEGNARRGGEKAKEAVSIFLELATKSCARLAQLARNPESRKAVASVARVHTNWPILLSPKASSCKEAKRLLKEIGVGTDSIPPTAAARRIIANDPWTKRAAKLIQKIILSRQTLKIQEESLGRFFLGHQEETDELFQASLVEARKWKQVLALPPDLNNNSCEQWWAVAESMLKADWEANPTEKNQFFKSVERSAKSLIRTKKKDPTALARSLETESKNLIVKSIREAFRKIAARRKTA